MKLENDKYSTPQKMLLIVVGLIIIIVVFFLMRSGINTPCNLNKHTSSCPGKMHCLAANYRGENPLCKVVDGDFCLNDSECYPRKSKCVDFVCKKELAQGQPCTDTKKTFCSQQKTVYHGPLTCSSDGVCV